MRLLPRWRWLRWLLVCRAGRACADVRPVDVQTPPGYGIMLRYACEGCGTEYVWDGGRRRARKNERTGIEVGRVHDLAGGESASFEATVRLLP